MIVNAAEPMRKTTPKTQSIVENLTRLDRPANRLSCSCLFSVLLSRIVSFKSSNLWSICFVSCSIIWASICDYRMTRRVLSNARSNTTHLYSMGNIYLFSYHIFYQPQKSAYPRQGRTTGTKRYRAAFRPTCTGSDTLAGKAVLLGI